MGSDDLFRKRKAAKKALRRNKWKTERKKRFLIVCEGTKTEPNYFRELIADLRIHAQVSIAPNDGTSPDRIALHAEKLYDAEAKTGDTYDAVYCVFDRDSHETFDVAMKSIEALQKRKKGKKPFIAITSTPCFEFWLLLHFGYTSQPFHKAGEKSIGDQVVKQLKTKPGFGDYEKGDKGDKGDKGKIGKKSYYDVLKDKLAEAITHAKRLREDNKQAEIDNPATDVDILVSALQALRR